jgi:hypothetical protein
MGVTRWIRVVTPIHLVTLSTQTTFPIKHKTIVYEKIIALVLARRVLLFNA